MWGISLWWGRNKKHHTLLTSFDECIHSNIITYLYIFVFEIWDCTKTFWSVCGTLYASSSRPSSLTVENGKVSVFVMFLGITHMHIYSTHHIWWNSCVPCPMSVAQCPLSNVCCVLRDKQVALIEGQTICPYWGTNRLPLLKDKQSALIGGQTGCPYWGTNKLPFLREILFYGTHKE